MVTIQSCAAGVTYTWSAGNGTVPSGPTNQSMISYLAPNAPGQDVISVVVQDTKGHSASADVVVNILNVLPSLEITEPPAPEKQTVKVAEQIQITVKATCAAPCNPANLTYKWWADFGVIAPSGLTDKSTVTYTAPTMPMRDTVHVTVFDDLGNSVSGESSYISVITDGDTLPLEHSISISTPKTGTQNCPGNTACLINVEGRFEGPDGRKGITVMVLALPVEPTGGGWWVQGGLIPDRIAGEWRIVATLGEDAKPPTSGHKFSLYALLVEEIVAKDPQYAPGVHLEDFSVIPHLAVSERVDLIIQSSSP